MKNTEFQAFKAKIRIDNPYKKFIAETEDVNLKI